MKSFKRKGLSILTVMAALSFSALAVVPAATAASQVFTVTNTSNSGTGSYRQAILDANDNPGSDTIEFDLPGSPSTIHTITPTEPLPYITDEVHIDGYSQTGASTNTAVSPAPLNSVITIELDGHLVPDVDYGGVGFFTGSEGSSVRGLSVYGFSHRDEDDMADGGSNIVTSVDDVTVAGNYVGVKSDGLTVGTGFNDIGISTQEVSGDISNITVGGINPEDRNIVYTYSENNLAGGVSITSDDSHIYGNYVGIGRDGVTDLTPTLADASGFAGPYSLNVTIQGNNNDVGGTATGMRNVIAGGTAQVVISSSDNTVRGNYLGTDYTGRPNANITNGVGVISASGTNNFIGGTGVGDGNIIAGVKGAGIMIAHFTLENLGGPGVPYTVEEPQMSVLGNSIYDIKVFDYSSFGNSNQGIDNMRMYDTGETPRFIPDLFLDRGPTIDVDANTDVRTPAEYVEWPVLNTATQTGSDLDISFTTSGAGRVEFFANDESTIFGYGPGQTYLGFADVNGAGDHTASLDVGVGDYSYKSLSADLTVGGSTSEFARNIQVGSGSDFDADGVSDLIEQNAMNSGDGNDDALPDWQQPTVSSYEIDSIPVTFVTDGCSSNGSVSSLTTTAIGHSDEGFAYPYGLTDFALQCSRGDKVEITKYVFDDTNSDPLSDYSVRKYRPGTETYEEVQGASISRETIGESSALVMSYFMYDGTLDENGDALDQVLDDDGVANGIIVDPVGLAHVQTSSQQEENNGSASGTDSDDETAAAAKTAKGRLSTTGAQYAFAITSWGLLFLLVGGTLFMTHRLTRRKVI